MFLSERQTQRRSDFLRFYPLNCSFTVTWKKFRSPCTILSISRTELHTLKFSALKTSFLDLTCTSQTVQIEPMCVLLATLHSFQKSQTVKAVLFIMESASKERLCIIGAGPSALSLLFHLKKQQSEDQPIPEVVCFERTEAIGGQWNYTEETGKTFNTTLKPPFVHL